MHGDGCNGGANGYCWQQEQEDESGGAILRPQVSPAEPWRAQKQLWLRLHGRELVAELGGFFLQVVHLALTETLVILRSADIIVWDLVFAHVIYGAGDLVRRGHQGLSGAKPPLQAPVKAPNAQWERPTDWAAMRQACAARWRFLIVRLLRTLPPERSFLGARPSQEQQCVSSGHVRMSVPISAKMVCARESLMPCTATRSTPVMRRI